MIDLERELRLALEEDARIAPPPPDMDATLRRTHRRQVRVVATGLIAAVIIVAGATAGVTGVMRSSKPIPVGPGPAPSPSLESTKPIPYGVDTVDWPTDEGAIESLLLQAPPALAKRGFDVEVLKGTFEGVPWPRKPGLVLCAPKVFSWGESAGAGELPRVAIYGPFCRGAVAYFVSGPPGSGTFLRSGETMSPSPSPSPDPSTVLTFATGSSPPAPGEGHRTYSVSWTEPHWGWTYRVEAESEDALGRAVEALVQVARDRGLGADPGPEPSPSIETAQPGSS